MIYLIYDYEEHGPEHLIACTKKENIESCLMTHMINDPQKYRDKVLERFRQIQEDGYPIGRHNLTDGWGGSVLEIVQEYDINKVSD